MWIKIDNYHIGNIIIYLNEIHKLVYNLGHFPIFTLKFVKNNKTYLRIIRLK
jgi:hypothetical protein